MLRLPVFWAGIVISAIAVWGALELPYVNWNAVVPPVDARPVRIRHDGKGDGQYQAPRSGNRRHRGIDLLAPLGSPVRAIRSGTVIEVGTHRGLGNFVRIDHGELASLYAHLNATHVSDAERVSQGALIGAVGKTGNAKHSMIESHVHLEVERDGERIDPTTLGLGGILASAAPEHEDGRGSR